MAEIANAAPRPLTSDTRINLLRRKISWLCQAVRWSVLAYPIWMLYLIAAYWSDKDAISKTLGETYAKDLSGLEPWQQAACLGLSLIPWGFTAYSCSCAWRLFTLYLSGEIFAIADAVWLRRLAIAGLIAQILAIAGRPLISILLTLHFPAGHKLRIAHVSFQPYDLLLLLLLAGVFAFAHIQKTAAEIAGENAEFV